MSKVERKEYQETKIMRTMSPPRHRTSNQDLTQFDNNLDNLLEDLQNSVSRPGSSLGHSSNNNYRETSKIINTVDTGRSSSLNRIAVNAANPATEFSSDDAYNYTSPDGRKQVRGFKKEHYSYSTSALPAEKVRVQNNINQLDTLLDDLQKVKSDSYNTTTGVDPGYKENKVTASSKTVQRELHYGDTPRSSRSRTLERTERDRSSSRDVQIYNEGSYGDIRQLRTESPSPSRASTLSKQTKVTNIHSYPVETVETVSPDINPEILAHLDPHLRPPGNTKVTTTIKTYTYEIPGSGDYPTNLSLDTSAESERYVYSPNPVDTTASKSFEYKKIENKQLENSVVYPKQPVSTKEYYVNSVSDVTKAYQVPPYQRPSSPGFIKEVSRVYQPGYSPDHTQGTQTYVYNETSTTRNINENGYPPQSYPPKSTYILKEVTHDTVNEQIEPDTRCYPKNPPIQTYIHKEVHNTTNTTNRSASPYQNGHGPTRDTETFDPKNPPSPRGQRPEEPVNINYKYVSKSHTTNKYTGGFQPSEKEPLIPRPFPTDHDVDGPPKKLDELMATIGNEPHDSPLNSGFLAHEKDVVQQKKVESLKLQNEDLVEQRKEAIQRTKNVSGPPVYYPPGHEMFAKKEESAAAWRAQGEYAKESGKYEYGADGSSKMKVKSGAAVVPVCLPLCCGLPCTIL